MSYANQHEYDNALEPELSDYRDELMFADFVEDVTLDLMKRIDRCGIDAEILMLDVEQENGGYQQVSEVVESRVTEEQYRGWLGDSGK